MKAVDRSENLAGWLASELRKPGRSQAALADRLGLHQSAVNRMALGGRQIKAQELEIIRTYLAETLPGHDQPDMSPESPGQRLRFARRAAGLRTPDVAGRLGVADSTVRNQENGTNGFQIKTLKRYAELYGVTAEWLMYGGQPPISKPPERHAPIIMVADGRGGARLQIDKTVPMATAIQVLALLEAAGD